MMATLAAMPARIVLVGAGKMGGALLQGWLDRGWGGRLVVVDPQAGEGVQALAARHGFALLPSAESLPAAEAIVLAIKPQMLEAASPALASLCGPDTVVISIMAGKTAADIAARLPARAIVRAMPNTPAAVGQGITGAYAGPSVSAAQRALATDLLSCVGAVEWLPTEAMIDAVTAVSGSGPAYAFYLVECLAAAARAVGFEAAQADRFARATVVGASALMAAEPDTGADALRRNVTSPGGTTAAALEVLMRPGSGLEELMREAVLAARDRARALAG